MNINFFFLPFSTLLEILHNLSNARANWNVRLKELIFTNNLSSPKKSISIIHHLKEQTHKDVWHQKEANTHTQCKLPSILLKLANWIPSKKLNSTAWQPTIRNSLRTVLWMNERKYNKKNRMKELTFAYCESNPMWFAIDSTPQTHTHNPMYSD